MDNCYRTVVLLSWCVVWLPFTLSCSAEVSSNEVLVAEISHSPQQPHSGESVKITAKLAKPAKAELQYQVVEPGAYVPLAAPEYRSRWMTIPMTTNAEARGELVAELPETIQTHRRLIRYRLRLTTTNGTAAFPAKDDPVPNLAYFVYDGVPGWRGAIEPKSGDPKRAEPVQFGPEVMSQVQSYFLIGSKKDVENATWYRQSFDKDYPYTGTFVANGKVYDHVRFRARGGVWRYAMGKNMWKVDFNKGHRFAAQDDYGRKYKTKWSKLNLRACIQQGDYGRRGEQGMYEAVGFRLFNLAGADAPRTHWASLRIVDEKDENPADQFKGDFWGLYLAIENEDGHFLSEHGLPDGNIYKMMFGRGELSNQGTNQPSNGSDLNEFLGGLYGQKSASEKWWRATVDLPRYYSYRSILEAIHHYDIGDGKNYDFYRNPQTGKWCVIPWDIDLTWGDHMYGNKAEPFYHPVLSQPALRLEYENRLREIRDLLFNPEEAGRLIDECAAVISRPNGPSIADADRAKWDYHPIMASRYSMRGKAGQGLFYAAARTHDFPGMVQQMKEYVKKRSAYIDNSLIKDTAIPETPSISPTGTGLTFKASPFKGQAKFAAMKWRVGEIASASKERQEPGRYEITPVWESPESPTFADSILVPAEKVLPGHVYRVRVRMKDDTGRWSHWSDAVQFVAGKTEAR